MENSLHRLLLGGSLLLTLTATGCASLNKDPATREYQNAGMPRLLIDANHQKYSDNQAALWLVVRAGSLQETEDQKGYAHFVEHMAFNGTERYPDEKLQARLAELGMSISNADTNAYTGFDRTVFKLNLTDTSDEKLDAAMDILSQWALHMQFDPREVEAEKPVILSEEKLRTPPAGTVGDVFQKDYFGGSRYLKRMPIGTVESVRNADASGLKHFYKTWYQPANMSIIATGDVPSGKIRKLFRQYFQNNAASSAPLPSRYQLNYEHQPALRIISDPTIHSGGVEMMFRGIKVPATLDDELNYELLRGVMNIWQQRVDMALLHTSGTIQSISTWLSDDTSVGDHMGLGISADLAFDDYHTAIRVMEGERRRLLDKGITATEFEQWKLRLLNQVQDQQPSAQDLASSLVNYTVAGQPSIDKKQAISFLRSRLATLTIKDMEQQLQKYLTQQKKLLVVYPAQTPAPTEHQIHAWMQEAPSQQALPQADTLNYSWPLSASAQPGSVTATRQLDNNITEWTLSNGITVLYRYSNEDPGKVAWTLFREGGKNQLNRQQTAATVLALNAIDLGGYRNFSGPEYDAWLKNHAMGLGNGLGFSATTFTGHGRAEDFSTMLRLLRVNLSEGRVKPDIFRYAQNRAIIRALQNENDPALNFQRQYSSSVSGQDPAFKMLSATELKQVTAEQAQDYYDTFINTPHHYRFAISGDISRSKARKAVLSVLASLPATGSEQRSGRHFPDMGSDVKEKIPGNGTKNASGLIRISVPKSQLEGYSYRQLVLMNNWLKDALFRQVREKESLTYHISSELSGENRYQDHYAIEIDVSGDPEHMDEIMAKTHEALNNIAATQPDAAAIRTWIHSAAEREKAAQTSNSAVANRMAFAPVYLRTAPENLDTGENQPTPDGQYLQKALQTFMTSPERHQGEWVSLP